MGGKPAAGQPSGERYVPELMGGQLIEAEHQARYRLALPHVRGKRVLDAGCGSGWGSELLLDAGAAMVVGVDVADEAVEESKRRVPMAHFVRGDLHDLPFARDNFDVIVCFEVVEHTHDAERSLDELVRVLSREGVLFVSSPNPAVYPAGNPFHIRELAPGELVAALSSRLRRVALFRQHLHLSSLIYPEVEVLGEIDCSVFVVKPIAPGHDPYSITISTNGKIPAVRAVEVLAPSDELDNLATLSAALTEERRVLWVDHERIVIERTGLLSERAALHEQLAAAGESLLRVMRERDEALAERDKVTSSLGEALSRGERLDADVHRLRKEVSYALRERDRYGFLLIRSEQDLARAKGHLPAVGAEEVVATDCPKDSVTGRRRTSMSERSVRAVLARVSTGVKRRLRQTRLFGR